MNLYKIEITYIRKKLHLLVKTLMFGTHQGLGSNDI